MLLDDMKTEFPNVLACVSISGIVQTKGTAWEGVEFNDFHERT